MAYKKFEVGEQAPTFEKEKGNVLEGVFSRTRTITTKNGEQNMFTVDQKGGGAMDVWGDTVLSNFFTNIPKGSMVKITCLGKEKSEKSGRTFNNYELEYDDSTADIVDVAREEFDL